MYAYKVSDNFYCRTDTEPLYHYFMYSLETLLCCIYRWMLKAPPVNPRTYIFSVLYCNCPYYNAIVGTIFQNLRFATLGP